MKGYQHQKKSLSNAEKVTKILEKLPGYFGSLAMASFLNENSFDQIVNAVLANIKMKKKLETWK